MALDFALLKEHPYTTGVVVIVGGLVVFYFLSNSQGSSTVVSGGTDNTAAVLSADEQEAQIQAGESVQNNAQQVALQQAQLQAQVANNQVAASVAINNTNTAAQLAAALENGQIGLQENNSNNAAVTTQQANQLLYAQNIQQMQDSVLESQINSGVLENANNNATALAGAQVEAGVSETIAGYQQNLALQGLQDSFNATESYQNSILPLETNLVTAPGGPPSANQTTLGLALINPSQISSAAGVSIAATQEQGAAAIASAQQNAAYANAAGSVLKGIFG